MATHTQYATEAEGQADFFAQFRIDPAVVLGHSTDGICNGNLLEFKLHITDLSATLFQAIKYLSKLRVHGLDVPAHVLLVDLSSAAVYRFAAADYNTEIHEVYRTAASRDNRGFSRRSEPEKVCDYTKPQNAQTVLDWLHNTEVHPIRITADCVVAWAERYYREVPGSTKHTFLATDEAAPGELREPRHFAGRVQPYDGDSYAAFAHILDRLNDKLKKIELGAFYTPPAYVERATELLRKAIERVPAGNDYIILDRCAGTGNLERCLTEEELSHAVLSTIEEFEYLELAREFGDRARAVVPPTYVSGDPALGLLRNGDALSYSFIAGAAGEVIRNYVDDPKYTIILFENPPYAEIAGIEAQKEADRASFGWKASWARKQMAAELRAQADRPDGTKAINDLANIFIWSGFRYYLRQPTDSYVVFAPTKYFKTQRLVDNKRFMGGLLFNRKHFHANVGAGVSVIWWANEPEPELPGGATARNEYTLDVFDLTSDGHLVAGSANGVAPTQVVVKTTSTLLSSLYDQKLPATLPTVPGIVCGKDGRETDRKRQINPVHANEIIGYLIAQSSSFENADLQTQLTRCAAYNGHGFYLTRTNFLAKLPLFVVGRYPAAGRWWERGVVNRCADNGDNFSQDTEFLKSCLIYTALSRHNKIRSFHGTDGVDYRNELCLDAGALATCTLANYELTDTEKALLAQWHKVLEQARSTSGYEASKTYGLCQIDVDLNTRHRVAKPNGTGMVTVHDYPILNGDIATLKTMLADYHATVIAPKLWSYGLLK